MTRIMAGAAALMVAFGLGGTAQAQDAAAGEKVFKKCAACHKVEDGKNGVGPHLHAIVGRAVGTVQGYKYSEAMAAYGATGAVWDAATLDHYLLNPKEHVKGTKMSFAGLKKDDERANVIAYLATLK